ncbi:hypothetical protein BpHYR1_020856 [Brachionus plicatilis]|uniref:Uncharacterized protein n=1 Tax=Brachionus plicatilis TaxID=10195 RepID=A0A3M7R1Y8_BRAPC|nr:hypothetical protein BpHYR1_020856 [Brachionus plicatilis]
MNRAKRSMPARIKRNTAIFLWSCKNCRMNKMEQKFSWVKSVGKESPKPVDDQTRAKAVQVKLELILVVFRVRLFVTKSGFRVNPADESTIVEANWNV